MLHKGSTLKLQVQLGVPPEDQIFIHSAYVFSGTLEHLPQHSVTMAMNLFNPAQTQLFNQPNKASEELQAYIRKFEDSVKSEFAAVHWNAADTNGIRAYEPQAGQRSAKDPQDFAEQLMNLRQYSDQFELRCMTFQRLSPDDPRLRPPGNSRPPDVDIKRWNQATYSNPDPKNCIPIKIEGFERLKDRMHMNYRISNQQKQKIAELQAKVEDLQHKHNTKLREKLSEHRKRIQDDARMVLKLYHTLDKISRMRRCSSIDRDSVQAQDTLRRIAQLDHQASRPRMRGALDEARAALEHLEVGPEKGPRLDADTQRELLQVLSTMDNGLMELRKVMNKNLRHIDVIREFNEGR